MDKELNERILKKYGLNPIRMRTPETMNQLTLALNKEDVLKLCTLRKRDGYKTKLL